VSFTPDSRTILVAEKSGAVRRHACVLCGGLDDLLDMADRRIETSGLEQSGTPRGA
jgi:hypothetical protein